MSLAACTGGGEQRQRPEPLAIDNALTEAEKQAGILTPEVMWKMSRIGAPALSPDAENLLYQITSYNMSENRGVTQLCVMNLSSGETKTLTDTSSNNHSAVWLGNDRIAFLSNRDGSSAVWTIGIDGAEARRMSQVGEDIEGFGISPDGTRAWYVVRTHVADRLSKDVYDDLGKSKARIYDDLMCRHWDYWDDGSYLHVYLADIVDGEIGRGRDLIGADSAWDSPLAPYFDMAEIAFSPDSRMLAYTCKRSRVPTMPSRPTPTYSSTISNRVRRSTSTSLRSRPRAVPSRSSGYDKYPVFSPDSRRIAFRSQRRAGNEADKQRLIVYDIASRETVDLTAGFDYDATDVIWDGNDALRFIVPYQGTHQVCRIGMDGSVELLTSGDHDITALTVAGDRAVVAMNTISKATELYGLDLSTGAMEQLTDVNAEIYDNIRMGRVEKRWVATTDGKRMLTWVILPPDFDPAKRYPALLYCQGGPQSVVSQFWSYRWNFQLMAARGYVVVAPNRRGCPSFGQEWTDQISGDYSGQNIRDYLAAIDDVAGEPWADEAHMGCVGASYGGYSVYYLAGHHEGRFKAFISHCGIFDFEAMYGQTEELFFLNHDYGGPYWDRTNAVAQRTYAHSPHRFVEKWGHADHGHHGRIRLPHPLHAVARSLHRRAPARHPVASGGFRGRGAPGAQATELAGVEPRILRLARPLPEAGGKITDRASRSAPRRPLCTVSGALHSGRSCGT